MSFYIDDDIPDKVRSPAYLAARERYKKRQKILRKKIKKMKLTFPEKSNRELKNYIKQNNL